MQQHELRLYYVNLPMQRSFGHPAAIRRASESLVIELLTCDVRANGECAPRRYVTGETIESVMKELKDLRLDRFIYRLVRGNCKDLLAQLVYEGFTNVFGLNASNNVICLLELLAIDYLTKKSNQHASLFFGGANHKPESLKVSQVLDSGIDIEDFINSRGPFHFVKVKASRNIEKDLENIQKIQETCPAKTNIMVDANMSWTMDEAISNAKELRNQGVELIEEPLMKGAFENVKRLRKVTGISVMLDESVCSLGDAIKAIECDACDAINLRVSKMGGLYNSSQIALFARENGILYQIGVQVAEVATLINAGRVLGFHLLDAITLESGQSDLFFNMQVISPFPRVNRTDNTVSRFSGPGFGVNPNQSINKFLISRFNT